MGIQTIHHNGKEIAIIDYTVCNTHEEMMRTLEEAADYFKRSPKKLLTVTDFTNTFVNSEFMEKAKIYGKEVFKDKRDKGALIGVSRLQKILLSGYNLFAKDKLVPFNTREEALKYLTS